MTTTRTTSIMAKITWMMAAALMIIWMRAERIDDLRDRITVVGFQYLSPRKGDQIHDYSKLFRSENDHVKVSMNK